MVWVHPQSLSVEKNIEPARWISEGRRSWGSGSSESDGAPRVASLIPDVFERYVRVLHPVYLNSSRGEEPERIRWAALAERNGKTVHSLMQFNCIDGLPILGGRPGNRGPESRPGTLEENSFSDLVELLSQHTATGDSCWYCLWDGFGTLQTGSSIALGVGGMRRTNDAELLAESDYGEAPRVKTSHREYILFSGDLDAGSGFLEFPMGQSPNIWWPDDRAWCVASSIDLQSTYVGGSAECIEAILDHPGLEAFLVNAGDRVDFGSDVINC